MQIAHNIAQLNILTKPWHADEIRIGLVPTMGNLHAGHLRLIEIAKQQAERIVVSIFVNPMQFNDPKDLLAYPQTLEKDTRLLAELGVQVVFTPQCEELFPTPITTHTIVNVPMLSDILCGSFRPNHFVGVSTIVTKLFNIVQPTVAVFGEKDYQQLLIVRQLVSDLNMPIQIVGVPTVREENGLAFSSRNNFLTDEERKLAPLLYKVLCSVRDEITQGRRDYSVLEKKSIQLLNKSGFIPDYMAICEPNSLKAATINDQEIIILVAASLGKARLIDNIKFSLETAKPSDIKKQPPKKRQLIVNKL